MTDGAVDRFARVAQEFCAWAHSSSRSESEELLLAVSFLAELYRAVLDLPVGRAPQTEPDGCSPEEWQRLFQRFGSLPISYYSETPDPGDVPGEEAVIGDVADDLADIYSDVSSGLDLYRAGHAEEAAWVCVFSSVLTGASISPAPCALFTPRSPRTGSDSGGLGVGGWEQGKLEKTLPSQRYRIGSIVWIISTPYEESSDGHVHVLVDSLMHRQVNGGRHRRLEPHQDRPTARRDGA